MAAEHGGLCVRLLGRVRAWRGDDELTLGSAHRQAVFAVLAMNANRTVSREELVDAIWGDNPPASAAGNVYTYVSALRAALEPGRGRWSAGQVLTSARGSYRLTVADRDVDALRFEALRDEGRRLRDSGDPEAELAAVREALDLWHGAALDGVPGPYAAGQRSRLDELRLVTVERRAELLLDLGRHDEAVAAVDSWTATHPTREGLHGLLMRALHAAGRRADALRVYDTLAERLIEDSGTEPGAGLRALRQEIGSRRAPAPARRPAPSPARRPPTERDRCFVGRVPELRRLRSAVADLAAGRGASLWFDGEPGIGRSTLLAEGLGDATAAGCRVGWGVGDELARRVPLGVLLECFDLEHDGREPDDPARRLVAALHDAPGDPAAVLLDRVVSLVRVLCAEAPLALVVDDMQWADDVTLLAWHHLHRLVGELPLLLVAACRPVPRGKQLGVLRGALPRQGADVVELPPLTDAEARQLVEAVAPALVDRRRIDRLVRAAAGNPYYLRHLVAAADDRPPTLEGRLNGPSATLVRAVQEHLDLLSDGTREVLRALAFLGDESVVTELAAVTGRSAPELVGAIDEAVASGLLCASGRFLQFRHPAVRGVLHDGTPAALRVTVHRAYAELLAAADAKPERVVRQLLAGPVPTDAWVAGWLVAHAEPMSMRIPETAVAVLRQATTQSTLGQDLREDLTVALARALFWRGAPAEAEAGWVLARTADPERAAEMRWIVAATYRRRGDDRRAAELLRSALTGNLVPSAWVDRYRELLNDVPPTAGRNEARAMLLPQQRRPTNGAAHRSDGEFSVAG